MEKFIATICLLFATIIASAQLQEGMALKYMVQQPSEKTAKPPVVILLHGYGSNELDLFELKSIFPKNYLVISARAPYPVGTQGYQWFSIGEANKSGEIEHSRTLVVKFISEITSKYKADREHVVLMGFSQGAMMSYEVGLLNPGLVSGIAPLSGRLFGHLKQDIKASSPQLKKLKIFIAHGTADERIKFAEGKAANDYLKSIGLNPEFHEYPGMGHSISNDVLRDLVKWLH